MVPAIEGRWDKGEYIWSCTGCGCVRTAGQVPAHEEAKCLRCRTTGAAQQIQELVDKLQGERDEYWARATKAEKENETLLDRIHELESERAA